MESLVPIKELGIMSDIKISDRLNKLGTEPNAQHTSTTSNLVNEPHS